MHQTLAEKSTLPDRFITSARRVFGDRLSLNRPIREQHGASETHIAPSLPDAVVFAKSTEEVVELVRLCGDHQIPITPYGAGTSLEGNAVPVRGGVSLDLSLMNAIIEINEADFDCRVQPGVCREELNTHLRDKGLFFPIDPGANATIGGMAATRASGTNAVRYGTMRDAVLALEIVTPDARVIRTSRRARKSAAGYDLTRLMVGSEGTLGIFTEVTVRLHGIPETIASAVCSFETMEGAVATVVQAIQLGIPLARIELLDDVQVRAINAWAKLGLPELTTLFFEFRGSPRYVDEQVETVNALALENGGGDFKWSNLPEERSALWKARHEAYYAALALRAGAVGWPTDGSRSASPKPNSTSWRVQFRRRS
jgi:D-lactate dehydrogenase (cytochrome)